MPLGEFQKPGRREQELRRSDVDAAVAGDVVFVDAEGAQARHTDVAVNVETGTTEDAPEDSGGRRRCAPGMCVNRPTLTENRTCTKGTKARKGKVQAFAVKSSRRKDDASQYFILNGPRIPSNHAIIPGEDLGDMSK